MFCLLTEEHKKKRCVFLCRVVGCVESSSLAFLTRALVALSVGDAIISESESEPMKKKNNRHIGSKSHVKGVMFSVFNQMKLKLDWKIVCSRPEHQISFRSVEVVNLILSLATSYISH